MKVLIVDDDESMRALLNAKLGKEYEVILAESGVQGIEILKKQEFDLISLDMLMPGMSGIETFRKMKSEVKDLPPVIMITGDKTLSVVIEFMQLGGADYVIKLPDFVSSLKLRIDRALEMRQLLLEKAKQEAELEELRIVRKVAVTFMHEINNLLSKISGANAILAKMFGKTKYYTNINEYVTTIAKSVKKLEKMTGVKTAQYSEKSEVYSLTGKGFY